MDGTVRRLSGTCRLDQRTRDLERTGTALAIALGEALKELRVTNPALARYVRSAAVQATRGSLPQCAKRLGDLPVEESNAQIPREREGSSVGLGRFWFGRFGSARVSHALCQ